MYLGVLYMHSFPSVEEIHQAECSSSKQHRQVHDYLVVVLSESALYNN
jgi:hypothetical protein